MCENDFSFLKFPPNFIYFTETVAENGKSKIYPKANLQTPRNLNRKKSLILNVSLTRRLH